ncbi:uncharacterized protein FIBRA_00873 [Fibroporia radiculosa]|uniref:Transmembrane protein n=1 Tax=Fibroporia radiculosa TaxID=599839 RepID=J4I864_9APHY|nr:uncharacterized protein FIBRA_00873 [Fibroporia radiculosa]CCL98866.1 predicted protein [Fibroporia radiculosa]
MDKQRVYPRQLEASETTSSYDYWWPYPAWTASTAETISVPLAVTQLIAPTTSSDTSVMINSMITAVRPMVTSSAIPSKSGTFIHITALPPASSSSASASLNTSHGSSFNIAYLAPLFAVLGVIAGAFTTTLLLRWYSHCAGRHAARGSYFESGPQYVPTPDVGSMRARAHQSDTLSVDANAYLSPHYFRSTQAEIVREIGRTPSTPIRSPRYLHVPRSPVDALSSPLPAEDDAFFRCEQSMVNNVLQRGRSGATTSTTLLSPASLADEDQSMPYDTLRHTSIRRGILERLKYGTQRRPAKDIEEPGSTDGIGVVPGPPKQRLSRRQGHKRQTSDVTTDETGGSMAAQSIVTPKRSHSLVHSVVYESPLLHTGFRIIEEDPEMDVMLAEQECQVTNRHAATHHKHFAAQDDSDANLISPWATSLSRQAETDTYTTLPARRSAKSSPFSTPGISRTSTTASPPAMSRVDSSVLPSSPPRIMSPPLESRLFFGAIPPDFGVTPTLNLQFPSQHASSSVPDRSSPPRQMNKLHTTREPPLLPFPSSSISSPYSNRLKKAIRQARPPATSPTPTPAGPSPPPGRHSGALTPTTGFTTRHSAHDKVDEIVSRSWSQRDVSADMFVRSPTLFGALALHLRPLSGHPDSVLQGGASVPKSPLEGIEQRLEALLKSKNKDSGHCERV